MILKRLDRLGNWNPQLIRELKGRLKPRNLAIALTTPSSMNLLGSDRVLICRAQRMSLLSHCTS